MSFVSALGMLLLLATLSVSLGCSSSHNPPQMVQLCLRDDSDVDQLLVLLEGTAFENGMEVVDRSSASQVELGRLGMDPGYRVVSFSASRPDGLGLAAGNLGLGANEVAIGFTQGANAEDSNAFIQSAVNALQSRWTVRPVAGGQGAIKSPECGDARKHGR